MFGRVRRAAAGVNAGAYAVLHTFSPAAVAGVLAVGMGAAGVGSGAAITRTGDGRHVSALAEAVSGTMDWGRREQRRFLRLPGRVLVIVNDESVVLYEWTLAKGKGRKVACWPSGSYTAVNIKDAGSVGVRVVVEGGQIAILGGPRGPQHRAMRATIDAIVRHGRAPRTSAL